MSKGLKRTAITTAATLIGYYYAKGKGTDIMPATAVAGLFGALFAEFLLTEDKPNANISTSNIPER